MATIKLTLTGDAELRRKLSSLSEAVRGKTLENAVVSAALLVQNDAKVRCKKVSGNLARSIHIGGHDDQNPDDNDFIDRGPVHVPDAEADRNRVAVYVGTDVVYAKSIEFGGPGRPQPYLRPAMDENKEAVRREFAEALEDLIRAATR